MKICQWFCKIARLCYWQHIDCRSLAGKASDYVTIFYADPNQKHELDLLKVSKSRKQFMVSSILPKNERWDNFMYWKKTFVFGENWRHHNLLSRLSDLYHFLKSSIALCLLIQANLDLRGKKVPKSLKQNHISDRDM